MLCSVQIQYPELSGFIQPLGGEYGGYRDVLENIKYTSGYGVEVQSLIEILENYESEEKRLEQLKSAKLDVMLLENSKKFLNDKDELDKRI